MALGGLGVSQGPVSPTAAGVPWLSVVALIVANLFPVLGVWQGWFSLGTVFITFWLENVVLWAVTIVKISTATGTGTTLSMPQQLPVLRVFLPVFFTFHFGLFTLGHGVFTAVLVWASGGPGPWQWWALTTLALVLSHGLSLAVNWFAQGERFATSPPQAMMAPYPRIIVLHVAIIVSSFALGLADANNRGFQLVGVAFICGLKIAIDVALHLRERTKARRRGPGIVISVVGAPGER